MKVSCRPLALVLLLAALAAAAGARAQRDAPTALAPADDAAQAAADPPNRAARLSYIEGTVSVRPAGVQDWNSAALNRPLTAGDALWSDGGARAEVDLGVATVRIGEHTSLALLDLSDAAAQLRIDAGTIDVTVNSLEAAVAFEIDAPNAAIALLRPGEYRIDVDNAGTTALAVRAGEASVEGGERQSMALRTGQRGLYAAGGSYAVAQAGAPDDFDRWCQQRQARWREDQAVTQYVSDDIVGYEDLNEDGQWQQVPEIGYVWFPSSVPDDWAPYSVGDWIWLAPWGWTWVDDAPWGFAPFHYGRWSYLGHRWGWVPGPRHRPSVYAPALVAWLAGPAVALGGGAAVGWLPLAPGEVYVPAGRVSPRYLQNVNFSNSGGLTAATIGNIAANPALQYRYADRLAPGAVTVVPQVSFTAGQPVARHRMAPPAGFDSAAPAARAPGIVPEQESVLGPVALSRVGRPPAAIFDRPVVTHRQPPAAAPAFALQQRAIEANGGRPLDAAALGNLGSAPVRAVGTPYRGIRERAPQLPPPPAGLGPNVFRERDQQIEQEREAQLSEQRSQELGQQKLPEARPQTQGQPQPGVGTPPRVPTPPNSTAQTQPLPAPPHPRTDVRRPPPPPPPPPEQR